MCLRGTESKKDCLSDSLSSKFLKQPFGITSITHGSDRGTRSVPCQGTRCDAHVVRTTDSVVPFLDDGVLRGRKRVSRRSPRHSGPHGRRVREGSGNRSAVNQQNFSGEIRCLKR